MRPPPSQTMFILYALLGAPFSSTRLPFSPGDNLTYISGSHSKNISVMIIQVRFKANKQLWITKTRLVEHSPRSSTLLEDDLLIDRGHPGDGDLFYMHLVRDCFTSTYCGTSLYLLWSFFIYLLRNFFIWVYCVLPINVPTLPPFTILPLFCHCVRCV